MTLFQFDHMYLIVPKFEWSCFNHPNMIKLEFAQMFLNVCKFNCILFKLEWSCLKSLKLKKLFEVSHKWIKLFEVTQNWMKMFHLARIWMDLLLFGQSWFSRLEFTQIFPIYGNIFNFTQIWMK